MKNRIFKCRAFSSLFTGKECGFMVNIFPNVVKILVENVKRVDIFLRQVGTIPTLV